MARKKTPEERLEELEARKKQLQAQVQRERQKLKEQERKRDTRRKVLIGSKVLEHARTDARAARYLRRIYEQLSERDKKAFEGFEFPEPETEQQAQHPAEQGHSTPPSPRAAAGQAQPENQGAQGARRRGTGAR